MAKEQQPSTEDKTTCACCKDWKRDCGSSGCIWFLGAIGAAIHYLGVTTGFWPSTLAILKAFVWPVFVVMKILGL